MSADSSPSEREVERREVKDFPVVLECRGCGKRIKLWFNGGELDRRSCCGYVYELEHVRIDLVVTEDSR